jgi:ubiquinone/menaquinone biosynthesis C-methylase UbiE
MKRDLICQLRRAVDSLPLSLRNSYLLFLVAKAIFKLPSTLYEFRDAYDRGEIADLSKLYHPESKECLDRVSKSTDINSRHLEFIVDLFKQQSPRLCLDVGCGSGFLIDRLHELNSFTYFTGIDYQTPTLQRKSERIVYIQSDLMEALKQISDDYFDLVICAHVIEHLSNPGSVIQELRRVTSKQLVVICPIEKKYRWGMNYHLNFYPTPAQFLMFMQRDSFSNSQKPRSYRLHRNLGDVMFVEDAMSL